MRIVMFYHSLLSDWNHGNAHFLRGIAVELISRGHSVEVWEPKDGWSYQNMLRERGEETLQRFREVYPQLEGRSYQPDCLDLDCVLKGADLVLVHEWNELELVRAIGEHHKRHSGYRLLFHDTHHRSVSEREWRYDLSGFDGVLAYGRKIRDIYLASGWTRKAWVWHEAADVRVFHPQSPCRPEGDLVWIGNWGDDERSDEIREFLIEPVRALGLKARVYGVRYPVHALRALSQAGIDYGGWLPNFDVPKVFARYRSTIHIPRRPYATALPGIPTIRPFEALACGIPLVSAPWEDTDGLFEAGKDFLVVKDGAEMAQALGSLLDDPERARQMAQHGCSTIAQRHTCAHRVHELLRIYHEIGGT
jgi:spore maturation protein CgeB